MLTTILLIYIGIHIDAPVWYFWISGVMLIVSVLRYGYSMYKAGRDW